MTIKAVLHNGHIQPLEPLPPNWVEGQELVVEQHEGNGLAVQIIEWANELDATTAAVPEEEHDRFGKALEEIERESKEAIRREWGLS